MNGLVPATILDETSKTFTVRLSVTMHSRQNGPIMPPNSSSDFSTARSPMSNSFGSRDSLTTTGTFPVTTKVG